jgi:ferredoxin
VRSLRRTAKDVVTFIPFIIILIIPLSPVGHVLVFSFIQRFFPDFFPTPYTDRRQNLMRIYQVARPHLCRACMPCLHAVPLIYHVASSSPRRRLVACRACPRDPPRKPPRLAHICHAFDTEEAAVGGDGGAAGAAEAQHGLAWQDAAPLRHVQTTRQAAQDKGQGTRRMPGSSGVRVIGGCRDRVASGLSHGWHAPCGRAGSAPRARHRCGR